MTDWWLLTLQDYIQTIGACLVQVGHATDGPTVELLQQLTAESSQLHGCIKLLNHKVHKAMLQGQMDTQLARAHTIDKFYKTFVVRAKLLPHRVPCLQSSQTVS